MKAREALHVSGYETVPGATVGWIDGKWMVGWKDDRWMNTWIGGQKNSGLRDQRKNFIKEVGLHCALMCREKVGGLHMGEL